MTKEELALAVIERLKQEYPDADCTLDYDQAWKLLVSVRLAAQCTDARVNVVASGKCKRNITYCQNRRLRCLRLHRATRRKHIRNRSF